MIDGIDAYTERTVNRSDRNRDGSQERVHGAGITTTEREHADLNTITVTYTLRVIRLNAGTPIVTREAYL